jgi:hypothetical protein
MQASILDREKTFSHYTPNSLDIIHSLRYFQYTTFGELPVLRRRYPCYVNEDVTKSGFPKYCVINILQIMNSVQRNWNIMNKLLSKAADPSDRTV